MLFFNVVYVSLTVKIFMKKKPFIIYKSLLFLFTLMCALVFSIIYDCINYLHTIIPFTYDGISTKNMGVFFSIMLHIVHRIHKYVLYYFVHKKMESFSVF